MVNAALRQAGLFERLANALNLLHAQRFDCIAVLRRRPLPQLDHQQIAVLKQCVDINRVVFFRFDQVHARSTANSSSLTSARVLGT
ncbi:hypothetical protein D3C72_2180310 [compost metagenome]